MSHEILFYAFALLITVCSIMVVSSRNPVTSAMFLVGDLFVLAALYAQMQAHFVAVIQVLVYAGAIVVLFLFVIMLLNVGTNDGPRERLRISPPEAAVLLLTLVGFLVIAVMLALGHPTGAGGEQTAEAIERVGGNTFVVGMELFTRYLWPFELASILILLAIVASIVIAKKDKQAKVEAQPGFKRRQAHGSR
jgi:NADH-quinone oxidoreductase subunit J